MRQLYTDEMIISNATQMCILFCGEIAILQDVIMTIFGAPKKPFESCLRHVLTEWVLGPWRDLSISSSFKWNIKRRSRSNLSRHFGIVSLAIAEFQE